MNRRELLHSCAAVLALQGCRPLDLLIPGKTSPERWFYSGLIIDPQSPDEKKHFAVAASLKSETKIFAMKNEIHSTEHDPDSMLKVFLPKSGSFAYYQSGDNEPKIFHPDKNNYFYGHGAFDVKRNVFYTTQSLIADDGESEKRKSNKGFIYVHSLDDFRIIDKFPTYGNDPHDIKLIGDEIVVCNGGIGSNICFIDPVTRKETQKFLLNDEFLSFGHIDILDEKNFVLATGAYRSLYPPAIFRLNRDKGLSKFSFPKGLDALSRVQLLSVVHFGNFVLATCPHTDTLFVWNREGEFVDAHHIVDALSLAVSPELNGVIIGTGRNDQPLRLAKFPGGRLQVTPLDWGLRSTGSHSVII